MEILQQVLSYIKFAVQWIFRHWVLVFIIIPMVCAILLSGYVGVVYLQWAGDREAAFERLFRYKRLIDRTEELREGYVYSYSDIDLQAKVVDIPTRIYDRNNEIIGEFFEQKREIVPYSYFPKALVRGVISSEDRDFYQHHGISYHGIFRAFLVNLANLSVVQGGSTITQQLAKVLFTDMERSLKRKIYEAFCAHEIEQRYDKQDILSMYLNLIYFGNGAYGVESTAEMFFGKSIRQCNETECAMIVATISNPRVYSPLSNLGNSIRKTRRIMKSMVDAGYITRRRADYQYKRFLEKWDVKFNREDEVVESLIGSFVYSSYRVNRAPFFNEYIRRILVEKFGEDVVKKGGLSVYTTIDAAKQDIAVEALRAGIQRQRDYHVKRSKIYKSPSRALKEKEKSENIEGALVAVNPYTGELISYVGGYDFTARSQLDHVQQIRRQPGSSFKPIVYCAALQERVITPSTVFMDRKKVFKGGYAPENYDKKYLGEVIVREALRRSINVVSVKVLDRTGYSRIFSMLQNALDMSSGELGDRFGKTLSMALGTYEVSPIENAILHSVIVNGGEFIKPFGIRYVNDYNGNIVWNKEEEVMRYIREKRKDIEKIIDPVAGAITVSMLKGVFEENGTASWIMRNWKQPVEVAGKTGTSTNYNDAWFVGYTPDLVTAVWIGNNKGAISLGPGRAGGVVSAPVWGQYIRGTYRNSSPMAFIVPDEGLTRQTICLDSGMVPREQGLCPRVAEDELFYMGSEPGEYCPLHLPVQEDTPTGNTDTNTGEN